MSSNKSKRQTLLFLHQILSISGRGCHGMWCLLNINVIYLTWPEISSFMDSKKEIHGVGIDPQILLIFFFFCFLYLLVSSHLNCHFLPPKDILLSFPSSQSIHNLASTSSLSICRPLHIKFYTLMTSANPGPSIGVYSRAT